MIPAGMRSLLVDVHAALLRGHIRDRGVAADEVANFLCETHLVTSQVVQRGAAQESEQPPVRCPSCRT